MLEEIYNLYNKLELLMRREQTVECPGSGLPDPEPQNLYSGRRLEVQFEI